MKRVIVLSVFFLLMLNVLCAGKDVNIKSPSKKLMVKIAVDVQGLKINLFDSNKPVLEMDAGRFVFNTNEVWNGYYVVSISIGLLPKDGRLNGQAAER